MSGSLSCNSVCTAAAAAAASVPDSKASCSGSVLTTADLVHAAVKVTWLRLGALVINLLLVVYLVWSKRLFGVRGGKAAYEARLRSESFIEVERAALAAAAPAQSPQPGPAPR